MTVMKHPTKCFCEVIRWVDVTGDVAKYYVTSFFPVLGSEMLNVDMLKTFCGKSSIDHLNDQHTVLINSCRHMLGKPRTARKVFCCHGVGDSGKGFCLGRASLNGRL